MSETSFLAGWTEGVDAVVYQSCNACRHVWYFRRGFCPACGDASPSFHRASGRGSIYSTSIVRRAATPEAKAHVPYAIVLVDMADGFRMMAHGDLDLTIGDTVVVAFKPFTDRRVPYAVKA